MRRNGWFTTTIWQSWGTRKSCANWYGHIGLKGSLSKISDCLQREENETKLKAVTLENAEQARVFENLHNLGVDMTQYLTCQYEQPAKIIRIDGSRGNDQSQRGVDQHASTRSDLQLHLHQEA